MDDVANCHLNVLKECVSGCDPSISLYFSLLPLQSRGGKECWVRLQGVKLGENQRVLSSNLFPEAELAAPWQTGAHRGQMIRLGTFSG